MLLRVVHIHTSDVYHARTTQTNASLVSGSTSLDERTCCYSETWLGQEVELSNLQRFLSALNPSLAMLWDDLAEELCCGRGISTLSCWTDRVSVLISHWVTVLPRWITKTYKASWKMEKPLLEVMRSQQVSGNIWDGQVEMLYIHVQMSRTRRRERASMEIVQREKILPGEEGWCGQ